MFYDNRIEVANRRLFLLMFFFFYVGMAWMANKNDFQNERRIFYTF